MFGLRYQPLADLMVDLTLKAGFLARQLPQSPPSAARVCLLEPLAMLKAALAYLPDLCAAVVFAVRVGCEIDQTEIDAKHADWLIRCGVGFGLRDMEIPDSRPSHQFRAANLPSRIVQGAALGVAQHKLPDHSPSQRCSG